jgi:cyclophilin family peptidyl-prolyl cis-trans isomerase/protein-disulfide isomerase
MKLFSRLLLVLLVGTLFLSACKINTPTPPAVVPPTETAAPTQAATKPSAPVEVPTELVPTTVVDMRLFDETNKMICTPYTGLFPELTAEQSAALAVFPEVSDTDWILGPADATLTIIEYSDFQCPACAGFYTELEKLLEMYPDDVRLVFRHFPLISIHPNATLAAQAAEAAGEQGKFWEMYHELFGKQTEWASLTTENFTAWLKKSADTIKLDATKFAADLVSDLTVKTVQDALDYGTNTINLSSTPTVLLNGRPWQYSWDAATLSMVMKVIKAEKSLYDDCPPWIIDQSKNYTATIETEKGDIKIQLYPKAAPITVNSFVFLSREGFYDGVTFHRVMKDFVAQTGDPSGTGMSGSGYEFRDEVTPELTYDEPGMVGMANAGPNTNGSQFFITYEANDSVKNLTGTYTIFGKVIEGMDVLAKLTERNPQVDPNAPAGDKIITIKIVEQ